MYHLEHPTLPESMYQIGTMWLSESDKAAFVLRLATAANAEELKAILREAKQMVMVSAKNLDALINTVG